MEEIHEKQIEQDSCVNELEQRIMRFSIEKKRSEKRNSMVSRILTDNRIRYCNRLQMNLLNDQIDENQNQMDDHNTNIFNDEIEEVKLNTNNNHGAIIGDIMNTQQDTNIIDELEYQKYNDLLQELKQAIQQRDIESISSKLDKINLVCQQEMCKKIRINVCLLSQLFEEVIAYYLNEPLIMYQVLNHLNYLLQLNNQFELIANQDLTFLFNIDILSVALTHIQLDDLVSLAVQLLQKIIPLDSTCLFLTRNTQEIIQFVQKVLSHYGQQLDILQQLFHTLTALARLPNSNENAICLIEILDTIPLNKLLTINHQSNHTQQQMMTFSPSLHYASYSTYSSTDLTYKSSSKQFIFSEIEFYYYLSRFTFSVGEYILQKGFLLEFITTLFQQYPFVQRVQKQTFLEIVRVLKEVIKNNGFYAIDLLLDCEVDQNSYQQQESKIIVNRLDNKSQYFEMSNNIVSLLIRVVQEIQINSHSSTDHHLDIILYNQLICLMILIVENSEINIHLPKIINLGIVNIFNSILIDYTETISMQQNSFNAFNSTHQLAQILQSKTLKSLFNVFKYLFQIFAIYKCKIINQDGTFKDNQINSMQDENDQEQQYDNKIHWVYSIYNLLKNTNHQLQLIKSSFCQKHCFTEIINEIISLNDTTFSQIINTHNQFNNNDGKFNEDIFESLQKNSNN